MHNATPPRVELSSIATSRVWPWSHPPPSASPGSRSSRARYGQRAGPPTGRPGGCQVRRTQGRAAPGNLPRERCSARGHELNASPRLVSRVRPLSAASRALAFTGPAFTSRGCPEHHRARAVRLKDVVYRTDTLYLCSQAAEIRDGGGGKRVPAPPQPVKTKKGMRLFPPDRPMPWEVGYRLGAALRKAWSAQEAASDTPGTHASPRPHIRRAHWHSYWVGSRSVARCPLGGTEMAPADPGQCPGRRRLDPDGSRCRGGVSSPRSRLAR